MTLGWGTRSPPRVGDPATPDMRVVPAARRRKVATPARTLASPTARMSARRHRLRGRSQYSLASDGHLRL